MGTRHLIAVQLDGEYKIAQYGQWDGYPGAPLGPRASRWAVYALRVARGAAFVALLGAAVELPHALLTYRLGAEQFGALAAALGLLWAVYSVGPR